MSGTRKYQELREPGGAAERAAYAQVREMLHAKVLPWRLAGISRQNWIKRRRREISNGRAAGRHLD